MRLYGKIQGRYYILRDWKEFIRALFRYFIPIERKWITIGRTFDVLAIGRFRTECVVRLKNKHERLEELGRATEI